MHLQKLIMYNQNWQLEILDSHRSLIVLITIDLYDFLLKTQKLSFSIDVYFDLNKLRFTILHFAV